MDSNKDCKYVSKFDYVGGRVPDPKVWDLHTEVPRFHLDLSGPIGHTVVQCLNQRDSLILVLIFRLGNDQPAFSFLSLGGAKPQRGSWSIVPRRSPLRTSA